MSENTIFRNRREAAEYLRLRGIKISKSKLYHDAKTGALSVASDGSVRLQDLMDYVHREKADTSASISSRGKRFPEPRKMARRDRYLSEKKVREIIRNRVSDWIRSAHGNPDLVLDIVKHMEADFEGEIDRSSDPDNARVVVLVGENSLEGGGNARS